MSAVSIKISERVANAARKVAEIENRSLTGQIEHWVKLGIEAEARLSGSARLVLKVGADDAPEVDLAEIRQLLVELSAPGVATKRFEESSPAKLRYELDPDDEDVVIEVSANGTRRRGRLEGREFCPFPSDPNFSLDSIVFYWYSILIQKWKAHPNSC